MSTMITGKDNIAMYRMLTLKSALKLELLGMKHSKGVSAYKIIKSEFGMSGNKSQVLTQFTCYIESLKKQSEVQS